jgi:hypothetical protein
MSIIGIQLTEAASGSSFPFDVSANAQEVGDIIWVSLMNDGGYTEYLVTAPATQVY